MGYIFQGIVYRVAIFRFCEDRGRSPSIHSLTPFRTQILIHVYHAVVTDLSHSMIGGDNQVDILTERKRCNSLPQHSDQTIHTVYNGSSFYTAGAVMMGHAIRLFKVKHNETGTFRFRLFQKSDGRIHPLFKSKTRLLGIFPVVSRITAFDGNIRTNPINVSCLHSLLLCRNPDRFTQIVVGIVSRGGISHRVLATTFYIPESVVDNTVVVRHQSRSQCIVVGESRRRIGGKHSRLYSLAGHLVQVRGIIHCRIIPAEGIQ